MQFRLLIEFILQPHLVLCEFGEGLALGRKGRGRAA